MFLPIALIIVIAALIGYVYYWANDVGPEEIGMITRHFGKSLPNGNVVAFHGEAGWQADLLSPGKHPLIPFWESLSTHPWIRVPSGTYAVIISQIGDNLAPGEKFVDYLPPGKNQEDEDYYEFLANPNLYVQTGGKKGMLLLTLPFDWRGRVHPGAFLILTIDGVFGNPVGPMQELSVQEVLDGYGAPTDGLKVTQVETNHYARIESRIGNPPPGGLVATRPEEEMKEPTTPHLTPRQVFKTDLSAHSSYQDPHLFIKIGGYTGQQIDPLGPGIYNINQLAFRVTATPDMTITNIAPGEVGVVKSKVAIFKGDNELPDKDKLVNPGNIGVWNKVLTPGAWLIDRAVYDVIIVPTHDIRGEATKREKDSSQDGEPNLRPVDLDTKDNLEANVYYKILFRVKEDMAPLFIVAVGNIDNFFNSLLPALLSDMLRRTTHAMNAVDLMPNRPEIIKKVTDGFTAQGESEEQPGLKKILADDYHVLLSRFIVGDIDLVGEIAKAVADEAVHTQQAKTQTARLVAETARIKAETAAGEADGARVGERAKRIVRELGPDGARQVLVAEAGQAPIPRVLVTSGRGSGEAATGATAGAIMAETSIATQEEQPKPPVLTPASKEPIKPESDKSSTEDKK